MSCQGMQIAQIIISDNVCLLFIKLFCVKTHVQKERSRMDDPKMSQKGTYKVKRVFTLQTKGFCVLTLNHLTCEMPQIIL